MSSSPEGLPSILRGCRRATAQKLGTKRRQIHWSSSKSALKSRWCNWAGPAMEAGVLTKQGAEGVFGSEAAIGAGCAGLSSWKQTHTPHAPECTTKKRQHTNKQTNKHTHRHTHNLNHNPKAAQKAGSNCCEPLVKEKERDTDTHIHTHTHTHTQTAWGDQATNTLQIYRHTHTHIHTPKEGASCAPRALQNSSILGSRPCCRT